jgi:hypothetical protein
MKNRLTHISPLVIIGLMCLLIAYTIYFKSIKAGQSFKSAAPSTQNAAHLSFFAYVVENSLGY